MIAIIDTGGANLSSITNSLDRLACSWSITQDPQLIRRAPRVILPGVGAARPCMDRIRRLGLDEVITKLEQPVLGICLGMQILFESSSEGDAPCLGIIPGNVEPISALSSLPLPHMGWNQVSMKKSSPLMQGIPELSYFYFVHSFRAPVNSSLKASCQYGEEIPAVVQQNNFFGVQFHPEKSADAGQKLLRNFLEL